MKLNDIVTYKNGNKAIVWSIRNKEELVIFFLGSRKYLTVKTSDLIK